MHLRSRIANLFQLVLVLRRGLGLLNPFEELLLLGLLVGQLGLQLLQLLLHLRRECRSKRCAKNEEDLFSPLEKNACREKESFINKKTVKMKDNPKGGIYGINT